ncbi:PAS domain-containing protein [Desulfohalobium retbaense]|uniref:histidine kinase n=1 Tax=Desulfohalobium retbaense (strain ATCC 49708 / DSM 5692 / JCM 16813 / HR100) TaxID=485915 RepID=C8X3Q7_DESRD|nr:PAS domain-containing protein [Desulfohalobium retbaense]ACV69054.1 putative PAS/PAC sensor protein [Desulfohalobium retbaense DSM 5692]
MATARALLIGPEDRLAKTIAHLPLPAKPQTEKQCMIVGALCPVVSSATAGTWPVPAFTACHEALAATSPDLCLFLVPPTDLPEGFGQDIPPAVEQLGPLASRCLLESLIETARLEKRDHHWQHFTQNLIDAVPSAMVVFDSHGHAAYWNAAGEQLTGQKKQEMEGKTSLGRTLYDRERPLLGQLILHTTDPHELRPYYPEGIEILPMAEGVRIRGYFSTLKKDLQGYYEIAARQIRSGDRLLGAVELIHDLNSLHELQNAIGQQEQQLQSLIANVPLPLVQTDAEGTIQVSNRSAAHLFDLESLGASEQIRGQNLFELLPELASQLPSAEDQRPLFPSRSEEGSGTVTYFRDKQEWEISYFVLKEQGEVSEIIWTWRNVTSQEEENRLHAALAVAGAISHELAQPLTAIINSAQLLESASEAHNERAQRHAAIIHRESERVFDLYHKLQNINRYKLKEYLDTHIFDLDGSVQPLTIPAHEE